MSQSVRLICSSDTAVVSPPPQLTVTARRIKTLRPSLDSPSLRNVNDSLRDPKAVSVEHRTLYISFLTMKGLRRFAGARRGLFPDVLAVTSAIMTDAPYRPTTRVRFVNAIFDAMHVFNNSSQDEETMLAEQDCIYALSGLGIDFFEIRPRLLERLRSCVAFMRSNILRTLESLVDKREAFGEDQVGRLLQYCGQAMTFIASAVEGCGPGQEEDPPMDRHPSVHRWRREFGLEEWSPEGNTFAVKFLCICVTSHDPQTGTVVTNGERFWTLQCRDRTFRRTTLFV